MGGDTKMELGFPATPLSAVPGICPERGVQPARRPSFAFGEGKFGTLQLPLLAVVVPLSATTQTGPKRPRGGRMLQYKWSRPTHGTRTRTVPGCGRIRPQRSHSPSCPTILNAARPSVRYRGRHLRTSHPAVAFSVGRKHKCHF